MKKLLMITLSIIISVFAYSQEGITYEELANATKNPSGVIGSKSYDYYVSKNGVTYSVGDTLIIGNPSNPNGNFIYITEGSAIQTPTIVNSNIRGIRVIIKNIRFAGTKRSGFYAIINTTATGLSYYYIRIENALEVGEIKSLLMSRDEALKELRVQQELLELGIINEEEYNIKREELIKYIK